MTKATFYLYTRISHRHRLDNTRGRGGALYIGVHHSCRQLFEGAGTVGQRQISTVPTLTP